MSAELRGEVVRVAAELEHRGLNHNSAGNVSARSGSNFLITPSGLSASTLAPDDVVELDLTGAEVAGSRRPSSATSSAERSSIGIDAPSGHDQSTVDHGNATWNGMP